MFPSTIPRNVPAPTHSDQWADEVIIKKMSLPSWVAYFRTSIGCQPSEGILIAKLISRRLRVDENSKRDEYDLPDEDLLSCAKKAVHELRWHEDAQWALRQWQDGGFDPSQGDFVAIYMKQVQGYGTDPEALREEVATKFSVPPQRVLVDCLYDYVSNEG